MYPRRVGYNMIASSVTDLAWLERVPADRPTLVVAEGLVIYLPRNEGLTLLHAITDRFPSGELIGLFGRSRFIDRMVQHLRYRF